MPLNSSLTKTNLETNEDEIDLLLQKLTDLTVEETPKYEIEDCKSEILDVKKDILDVKLLFLRYNEFTINILLLDSYRTSIKRHYI